MEYKYLGKSGLQVSTLSFGSWLTFGKQIGDNTAEQLMDLAYDHGVNFFDNAEIYAKGESERVMGEILKNRNWDRSSFLVSSKVFFGDGGRLPNQTGLSRKHVVEACNASLKRLQVDYLDLYFCHRPDKNTPIAETVWTMNHLIQQGKILYWGTSEWSAQEIMEAHMVAKELRLIGPVMEQPQYNMFHRDKVEVEYSRPETPTKDYYGRFFKVSVPEDFTGSPDGPTDTYPESDKEYVETFQANVPDEERDARRTGCCADPFMIVL